MASLVFLITISQRRGTFFAPPGTLDLLEETECIGLRTIA
jgi:hypothetical protein